MRAFLDELFGAKPADLYVLVWTLPNKRSAWFTDLGAAAAHAEAAARRKADVYVGLSLSHLDRGPTERGRAADSSGIVGLWADLDVRDAVHKKGNLPPSIEDARSLIADVGAEPSIVVHSGHGLQVYWLFREPWIFESTPECREAMDLSARWGASLRERARLRGWDVDSTHDISRVLRLPGTTNWKDPKAPAPVSVLERNGHRYDPSELERYLLEGAVSAASAGETVTVGNLVLDPRAVPPFEKFELLSEIEAKFRASWERKRRDLQDQSASGYDLSLAWYAVMAGWTDQEIASLLIAARRKHGDDLKLREDYYGKTIAKARATIARSRAVEAIDEISVGGEIIAHLSSLFDVPIRRIVKYMSDPPEYRLETELGTIALGDVGNLIGQPQLRTKVAAACGRYLPRFKNERWDKIAQALLDACVEEGLGDEATEAGAGRAWLEEYLSRFKPLAGIAEAEPTKQPFSQDGHVFVFGTHLRRWLALHEGEKVTAKGMGTTLRAAGAKPETLGVTVDGRFTTRCVWKISPYIGEKK